MQELTCIGCPLGCLINVEIRDGKIISVTGNTCKRGWEYAVKEMTDPTRIVTTTVRIENREGLVLPVKTKKDIPKKDIMHCIAALKKVTVKVPVHIGDVVLENVSGTSVPVVATKNIE